MDQTPQPCRWRPYLWALAVPMLVTAAGWLLFHGLRWPDMSRRPPLADTNVLMLYLLGVLAIATRSSRGPAIAASVLSVAAFDFCFVPPYLAFTVHNEQYLITFAVMLATALTISTLTHEVRRQATVVRVAWEQAELERVRNTMLSAVSHDLRTPLAAISGAAGSLAEAWDRIAPGHRAELLETICDEVEGMDRIVTNFLDMAQLESGGLKLKRGPVHLQEAVGSALRQIQKRLGRRQILVDIDSELPLLDVDDVAVQRVLVNLIANAVEHAPSAEPITIGAWRADRWVEVTVADRGPGLPPGDEQRVFQKFYRAASGSPRRNRPGAGLGLAICKALVEAHGGHITGENRPGGGASFRFTLPVAEADESVCLSPRAAS